MACGIETLVIALQLARGLVAAPVDLNQQGQMFINAVCKPCQCMPGATRADQLRCEAAILDFEQSDAKAKLADYKEFQRLAGICASKPEQQASGAGTVSSVTSPNTRFNMRVRGPSDEIELKAPDTNSGIIVAPPPQDSFSFTLPTERPMTAGQCMKIKNGVGYWSGECK